MSKLTQRPGRQWHFYDCQTLRCGFFYEDGDETFPPSMAEVYCNAVYRPVEIKLVGLGVVGLELLQAAYGDERIFPVDLHSHPPRIKPGPSLNMPDWRCVVWRQITSQYLRRVRLRPHVP